MVSSTASTGSKRCAVDKDETPGQTDETRQSKRQKPSRKTSTNGEQTISHYFTRKQPNTRQANSLGDIKGPEHVKASETSQNPRAKGSKASKGPNPSTSEHSSKQASTKEAPKPQRKDRSISPPVSSRHKRPSMASSSKQPEDSQASRHKREPKDRNNTSSLNFTNHIGDIFDAPTNSLLIHACNCKGWWSKGIAAAFKKQCPSAFKIYEAHCKKTPDKHLIGTALFIPPQRNDRNQHFVGCLFTSAGTGFRVDPPHKILKATGPAMTDLLAQARSYISSGKGDVSEIRICKINSGLFKVEWEDTLEVLKKDVEPHGFKSLDVFSTSAD